MDSTIGINRYIQSEKTALNGYVPIDRYFKNKAVKIETHLTWNAKNTFHELNAHKPRSDYKVFIRPDLDEEAVNQRLDNYRELSDDLANVKITKKEMASINPGLRKIIQNRFI